MAEGLLGRPDDRYANVAAVSVTESAANTLTFGEVDFGIGLGAGVGLLIDQIDYYFSPTNLSSVFSLDNDSLVFGLTTNNTLTDLEGEFANRSVIHMGYLMMDFVTSGMQFHRFPLTNQFFPPLIVGTNRGKLFLGAQGISAAAAATVKARIYFRYIRLTDREYLELAEAFNLMG